MKKDSLQVQPSYDAARFTLTVHIKVKQKGGWFYSSSPVFDVHSQGRSEEEALNNITEALQLFVESCYERGTLEQAMKEIGFAPAEKIVKEQQHTATSLHRIDVPFDLLVAEHVQQAQAH